MIRNRDITDWPVHICLRLYNSIPRGKLRELEKARQAELRALRAAFERTSASPMEKIQYRLEVAKVEVKHFQRQDYYLDRCNTGPAFLDTLTAKNIILDSWHYLADKHGLQLHAISVMSNHFHVLLNTKIPDTVVSFDRILNAFKRFTAGELNKLDDQIGRRVWPEKAFDRDVREGRFNQVFWYILNNPVKAGLTKEPLTWFGNYHDPECL